MPQQVTVSTEVGDEKAKFAPPALADGPRPCPLGEDLLSLPFFLDVHRSSARAAGDWVAGQLDLWSAAAAEDLPREVGTRIRRRLGRDGWLAHLDPDTGEGLLRDDMRSTCLVRTVLANAEDLADFAFSIQSLASAPIREHGSPEQRRAWLPGLARGELGASLALSERSGGSDLKSAALRATPVPGGYRLHGEKSWIAMGDTADVHCVLARTGEGPGPLGLSMFLIPADSPGLTAEPVGATAPRSFAHLHLDGVVVPESAVVGRPGRGYVIALAVLDRFRMSVGAAAVGLARRAAVAAADRARARTVDGGLLADLGTVQASLGDMEVDLQAAELLVARAAWDTDEGRPGAAERSALAKLHATEAAQRVVDATVQIFGAAGVEAGSTPERLYRQVRSLRIYEGASEIQRKIVADGVLTRAARRNRRPS